MNTWPQYSVNTKPIWIGSVLLGAFVALLVWYFAASYLAHRQLPPVAEKMLTLHDDLLAIDGAEDGKRVAVGKFGLILVTNDNGKTWERRATDTTKALSAISFGDPKHGFVVGNGGTLLATSDGGANWHSQSSGSKDQLLGVYALNATNAYVVGAFGTLLSTSDAGQNWIRHELKWDQLIGKIINDSGYVEPNLNAIYFSSPMKGWIVGEFGLVLHTEDGGSTWTAQRSGSDLPQLYAVKFVNDQRGWAIGQAGSLIHTTDGGKRWAPVEINSQRDLYNISVDGQHCIIVGDGIAFGSDDAGSSWKEIRLNSEDRWLSGVLVKDRSALAVGPGGTIQILNLENPGSVPMETR
ncbi:MAG TPA: YCF48-related protein [Phototrophicaceae bacterium]|nr:YCF48-related protein [Phototrophicaceae bacterium]